jgi:hypothetical protein
LWKKYDYRDFGIIAEPYFDIDFNEVLYLTDTSQRWDGVRYSLRDKTNNYDLSKKYSYNRTFDILRALEENSLHGKVLINVHPERWQDNILLWIFYTIEQLVKRNIKLTINMIKNRK